MMVNNITASRLIRGSNMVLLALLMVACHASEHKALNRYIQTIKHRAAKPMDSMPEFRDLSQSAHFKSDPHRSPFDFVEKTSDIHPFVVNETAREKKISLNFKNIKIRTLLQLLAEHAHMNLVVSDSVTGSMTLQLNDVPWPEALDIILTTQGLAKRFVGRVVLIDKADLLVERENAALMEQEAFKKMVPLHSALVQINYAKAVDLATMLNDKSNSLLSLRGAVSVDPRTNVLWLQDTEANIKKIKGVLQRLDIPIQQVVIEARIVALVKSCEDELGVRWGISKQGGVSGTLAGANQLKQGILPPLAERLNQDFSALPLAGLGAPASIGLAIAKLGNGILLDLELSALESEGRAEIIARPRLMTTNQQSAMIQSGEDIPYQQATSSGATAVSFKKAVLSLKVTPQITPDGQLLMDLLITQDADSLQRVNGVPIVTTKSIQTNVLVNNRQTIVLGGIYSRNKNDTITRVPFLGRLPIVGHFFSRKQTRLNNEELLIFITPRIITNNHSRKGAASLVR